MSAIAPACASIRGRFGDYLRDALEPAERRGVREHLSVCGECREAGLAADPTLLFARALRQGADSPDEVDSILRAVRTGVSLMEAERRIGSGGSRHRRTAFAAAAALGLLTLLIPGGSGPRPAAETQAEREVSSEPAVRPAAILPPAGGEVEPARSNATVYDWNPGAGREEPRVVWIVDRGLDI